MGSTGISYLTRKELDSDKRFSVFVTLAVPLLAIFLQHYIPIRFRLFLIFDLPFLVTVFFAVARRNAAYGSVTGATIGLLQDTVSGLPLGINGLANTVVGYCASSLGTRIDVESVGTRLLMTFCFKLVHDGVQYLVQSRLLSEALNYRSRWEFYSAALNAVVGVILFRQLDRLKQRN